ncbi:MAG: aminoacyl-tRNA hydrolase [Deltaproteobacteria bacterium]|nr:aminoacyl-tRNA hydrolase [Deltaproteobacteria bacterium]MBW2497138.1 aminoacyl-tRNA hydrolase [Deltaproteobacteria bacterium]
MRGPPPCPHTRECPGEGDLPPTRSRATLPDAMVRVNEKLSLDDDDLSVRFVRAGGPGGQNVNKVATKAELRFALETSDALSRAAKQRLRARYPSHVTEAGDFIVVSNRYRSQARNRADAEERLAEMIRTILSPPKPRKKTSVSKASRERRLRDKRHRAEVRRSRRPPGRDE